jgi:hypothetical protein
MYTFEASVHRSNISLYKMPLKIPYQLASTFLMKFSFITSGLHLAEKGVPVEPFTITAVLYSEWKNDDFAKKNGHSTT